MAQQSPFGGTNDKYAKRLFVDNGDNFFEVRARIVEPYTPPTPSIRTKEQKIVDAPSFILGQGISSYKISLTLLFYDKDSFLEYQAFIEEVHKFYDERGFIYLGAVETVKVTPYEANTKFKVEIELIAVKKDTYEVERPVPFIDIAGNPYEDDIVEMARLGLVTTKASDNTDVLYFRPFGVEGCTRAEYAAFLNRTRKWLDKVLRR